MCSGVGILKNGLSADVGLAPLGDGVRMTKPSGIRGEGAVFALRIQALKACGCTYVVIDFHLLLA